ncbi:MAG: Ig-like domain repeat protein [Dehalococcoidia bacterium]|nr:Ig-like domain repeat protein [Dehalococcoidia bacterium]
MTARTVTVSTVTAPANGTAGSAATLGATYTPTAAPGSIKFWSGTTLLGTASSISGGSASISWIPTATGSYTVTATYESSDTANYASQSSSPSATITVAAATATVTLPNYSVTIPNSVTLVATISAPAGLTVACTGCVTFKHGPTLAAATTFATVDVVLVEVSTDVFEYRAQTTVTAGTTTGFTTAGSATVWAVYGNNGAVSGGSDSGTVTVSSAP